MDTIQVTPDSSSILNAFIEYYNAYIADYDVPPITKDEVYMVWFCYIVGNSKALISTTRMDHKYYEVTYHLDKGMLHVDEYLKVSHESIKVKNN